MSHGKRLLIVCTGNTCRSPMAEALAREISGGAIAVESAGIEAADGVSATRHAIEVVGKRGGGIKAHRSRSIEAVDLRQFDIILAMTPWISDRLQQLGVDEARIRTIDVADPYCNGLPAYRKAADEIEVALRRLVSELY